jgi:ribosomal protein L11 methyltransferase
MEDKTWLEVSLVVDGEMAEAVAEVLARFAYNGVAIESTAVTPGPDDSPGEEIGPLRVAAYLPINDELEATRQKLEEALWYLGRIRPLPAAAFQVIEEANWAEAWKEHYHPILIGTRLVIVPAWLESPAPERLPIKMDPGMAFGTGTHPTTQLCLELIEATLQPGETVIDIGAGSGILSVAALLLGASRALAVDIDPITLGPMAENAAKNGVAAQMVVGLGSVAEVRAASYPDFPAIQAPLVLANILAPVLIQLFEVGLGELVSPGGRLILSGILDVQVADVLAAAARHGFRLAEQRQITDWVALLLGPI